MPDALLPSNATAQERALEASTARISAVPTPIRDVWNSDTCPEELLPWLAWQFSVDRWDGSWPEATKRAVIASSVNVHRHKGTVASIKEALSSAGYPNARITEGVGLWKMDGSVRLDGSHYLGDSSKWALYRVQLDKPISNAQAAFVRTILASIAPLRCRLEALDFSQAAFLLDGSVKLNGSYNLGLAT